MSGAGGIMMVCLAKLGIVYVFAMLLLHWILCILPSLLASMLSVGCAFCLYSVPRHDVFLVDFLFSSSCTSVFNYVCIYTLPLPRQPLEAWESSIRLGGWRRPHLKIRKSLKFLILFLSFCASSERFHDGVSSL